MEDGETTSVKALAVYPTFDGQLDRVEYHEGFDVLRFKRNYVATGVDAPSLRTDLSASGDIRFQRVVYRRLFRSGECLYYSCLSCY